MFENREIAKVMRTPTDEQTFFTFQNMEKVQKLLSTLLEKPTISGKRNFTETLPREDFELLIRAYFHLVENTILAHSNLRH